MVELDIRDRDFWHRYSKSLDAYGAMGFRPIGWQKFEFETAQGKQISNSMLTIFELSLLYALARHSYQAKGLIVDAGCLLGASTYALARGLGDNIHIDEASRKAKIYSFDLFSSHGYERFLGETKPVAITGSLLPEFISINAGHLDRIVVHQGDFAAWPWPKGNPVEILFIDLAKTWSLNRHVINNYFPALIAGNSIVIQQDYIHFNEYWIHLTMEYYMNHFELLGMMYGATAYYLCIKSFDPGGIVDLERLSYREKMDLLDSARSKADPLVQQVMKSAAAKCAIEHGELDDAKKLLDSIDLTVPPSHPTLQVRGIAESNRAAVADMLLRTQGGSS